MNVIMSIVFLVVILCIILIWYIISYNKFQEYVIRINESEIDIDSTLRKRYDLLNKSIEVIKSVTGEKKVLEQITEMRSQKLNNFDLDRKLYDAINEFNSYKENNLDLRKNENFIKIDVSLNESEAEIEALRKYYNDIISDYNKIIKSIPSNIVAKINKFKEKKYFDGKNLTENGKSETKL